jgi:hypothetical protein
VSPRKAANSRGPEKAEMSWTLAAIAEAVTGPIPGTLIRRACGLVFSRKHLDRSIAASNLLVKQAQLTHQKQKGITYTSRKTITALHDKRRH